MTTEQIITIVGIVLGSGGLWTFLQSLINKKREKKAALKESIEKVESEIKDLRNDLKNVAEATKGVLYERCKTLGEKYLERGYWSFEEMSEYNKYCYEPYKAVKGDGAIDLLYEQLMNLPIEAKGKEKKGA